MSTLDATISMLETMPEEARIMVYQYTRTLFSSKRPENPFTPINKEKILTDLAVSTSEFESGQGQDAKSVIVEMRKQHGFI